ncbi:MAG: MerR family transcriptional regulator [Polyangiales bacterium]
MVNIVARARMKISELSQASQVPLPTIKFYIREGLLPAGRRTSKNQADYDSSHLGRLALIRELQAAGMRLDTIARALQAADTATEHYVIAAVDALERPVQAPVDPEQDIYKRAGQILASVIKRRGWKVSADDIAVQDATRALAMIMQGFGGDEDDAESLDVYAEAADLIAAHEVPDGMNLDASREEVLRYVMLGTVLFEPFVLALRRMAHVARTRKLLRSSAKSSARKR